MTDQGESNVGEAAYYACEFPALIQGWRRAFQPKSNASSDLNARLTVRVREAFAAAAAAAAETPDNRTTMATATAVDTTLTSPVDLHEGGADAATTSSSSIVPLWFGFVQIAGINGSLNAAEGDLRQAQLAALSLNSLSRSHGRVGLSTAVDTGDPWNIHPPDKQNPARRLAHYALMGHYNMTMDGAEFPMYAGAKLRTWTSAGMDRSSDSTEQQQQVVVVVVSIRAGGKAVQLTMDAPTSATQSSSLNVGQQIQRNECISKLSCCKCTDPNEGKMAPVCCACNSSSTPLPAASPLACGWPAIIGYDSSSGQPISLNATATVESDDDNDGTPGGGGSSIVLRSIGAVPRGFVATATSYGRGAWPMTLVFASGGQRLPVIPWYGNLTETRPWVPPCHQSL
jgi:hypothetical protein